jgi:hypothetical protein
MSKQIRQSISKCRLPAHGLLALSDNKTSMFHSRPQRKIIGTTMKQTRLLTQEILSVVQQPIMLLQLNWYFDNYHQLYVVSSKAPCKKMVGMFAAYPRIHDESSTENGPSISTKKIPNDVI